MPEENTLSPEIENPTFSYIPDYIQGMDLETKGVKVNAFILAIGSATINVRTLRLVNTLSLAIDPNDEFQSAHRSVCKHTIRWWESAGSDKPGAPTKAAQRIAWSGTMDIETALNCYEKFLSSNPRNKEIVVPMRGPDFDYVIMRDLFEQFNKRYWQRPSLLDSHRTIERIARGFQIPEITEAEIQRFAQKSPPIDHIAVYDAAKEAYETARLYHFVWHVVNRGYEKAMEMVEGWAKGIILDIPEPTVDAPVHTHKSSC